MRPKKSKDLIPATAIKCDVSEEEARAVIDHYYQEVREALSSLSNIRVHLSNLGDFTIKHWLIDGQIKKVECQVNKRSPESDLTKVAALKLYQLNVAKASIEEEQQRKDYIHNHKRVTHEIKQRSNDQGLEE